MRLNIIVILYNTFLFIYLGCDKTYQIVNHIRNTDIFITVFLCLCRNLKRNRASFDYFLYTYGANSFELYYIFKLIIINKKVLSSFYRRLRKKKEKKEERNELN